MASEEADEGFELPKLELKVCFVIPLEADGTEGWRVKFGLEAIGAVKHEEHNETIRSCSKGMTEKVSVDLKLFLNGQMVGESSLI